MSLTHVDLFPFFGSSSANSWLWKMTCAPGWRRAAWWECPESLVRNSPTCRPQSFLDCFQHACCVSTNSPVALPRNPADLPASTGGDQPAGAASRWIGSLCGGIEDIRPVEGPEGGNWVTGINVYVLSSRRCGKSLKSFASSYGGEAPKFTWASLRLLFFINSQTIKKIQWNAGHDPWTPLAPPSRLKSWMKMNRGRWSTTHRFITTSLPSFIAVKSFPHASDVSLPPPGVPLPVLLALPSVHRRNSFFSGLLPSKEVSRCWSVWSHYFLPKLKYLI